MTPKLHWAFIAGQNDDVATVEAIIEAVASIGLRVNINIVRYNPFSSDQGTEPPEEILRRNAALLRDGLPGSRVKVVTRVGSDVQASCGMFVADSMI
jgi:adenine C2-methylase RlmN of 23S rRNA A2503 and tRNA A37